ncbi:MAG: hypothetical protein AAGF93_23160 [Cyanobacteria bacterium P01_H01_bin.105]
MEHNRAHSTAVTHFLTQPYPHSWLPTASGMLALTVGLQGAAANAVGGVPFTESTESTNQHAVDITVETDLEVDTGTVTPVELALQQPRFSQLKSRAQQLLKTQAAPAPNLSIVRLENHRRELHRRSNEVESQLLGVQQLLSIQSYGNSFADQLLNENDAYQTQLQQLQALEAKMHTAIEQSDMARLSQLQNRLQSTDQELWQIAQKQLEHYMEQAQTTSTLGLWQEPMYRESLRWLMEHTHQRHLLKARQQILARTLVAVAAN